MTAPGPFLITTNHNTMTEIRKLIEKCKSTQWVKTMMAQLGISQADIVRDLGFSRSTISKVLSGDTISSPAQKAALGLYFTVKLQENLNQAKNEYLPANDMRDAREERLAG